MKKEDLYLNENACKILLNIPALLPLINALFDYEDVESLYKEITSDNKINRKYKITYEHNSRIAVYSPNDKQLLITLLNTSEQLINICYKLGEYDAITYTLHVNYKDKNKITASDITIHDIAYKQYRFKDSLAPLHITMDDNHNHVFSFNGLSINAFNLEPIFYMNRLPKYSDITSFSSQQEKIKLNQIINNPDYNLNDSTKDLIKNLGSELDKKETEYKKIINIYNEWKKQLEEHKLLVDLLSNYVFDTNELNLISKTLDDSLSDESAKSLIKSLGSNMIDALKRQLKN
jgi:hypothetical protein